MFGTVHRLVDVEALMGKRHSRRSLPGLKYFHIYGPRAEEGYLVIGLLPLS